MRYDEDRLGYRVEGFPRPPPEQLALEGVPPAPPQQPAGAEHAADDVQMAAEAPPAAAEIVRLFAEIIVQLRRMDVGDFLNRDELNEGLRALANAMGVQPPPGL